MSGLSVPSSGSRRRWAVFLTQAQLDLRLWLFAVLWLGVFRALMLAGYSGYLGPDATWGAILDGALTGARFDVSIATLWALPGVLASLATLMGAGGRFAAGLRR